MLKLSRLLKALAPARREATLTWSSTASTAVNMWVARSALCKIGTAARAYLCLFVTGIVAFPALDSASAAIVESGFTQQVIATSIANPTAMAIAPDGRIFVTEQQGSIRVINGGQLSTTPFLNIGAKVDSSGERGLLGIAFDPNFQQNRWVYVYYTSKTPNIHNRVSRFTANGNIALAGSEKVLLDIEPLSSAKNHNGGAIHFGPGGKLLIAVGG